MVIFFSVLSLLCFAYFGVLLLYSGPATSLLFLWPVFGVLSAALARLLLYMRRHGTGMRLRVMTVTFAFTCIAVLAATSAVIMGSALFSSSAEADYCIVLGARVRGRTVSNSLKLRLDRAAEYASKHQGTKLVLTGGRGEGEEITEARAMYDYLLEKGIEPARMILEDHAENTHENLLYSIRVIDQREYDREKRAMRMAALGRTFFPENGEEDEGFPKFSMEVPEDPAEPEDDEPTVAVLTSNFHLLRAKAEAAKQGVRVIGIAASSDPVMLPHLLLRECCAVLVEKFFEKI